MQLRNNQTCPNAAAATIGAPATLFDSMVVSDLQSAFFFASRKRSARSVTTHSSTISPW